MTTKGNDVERRGSDVMQALRAADPAGLADLTRTDERAFTALREGITLTPRDTNGRTARRARRVLTTGGLALVLVGGSAAYASYDQWFGRDGGDDVVCLSVWVDPQTDPGFTSADTGGPLITTDPVADCQQYQEISGKPAIVDPVAFTYKGRLIVTPRSQRPGGGSRIAPPSEGAVATKRLEQSLGDYVDGGNSKCFDRDAGMAFVKEELKRLDLAGWKVVEQERPETEPAGPCGWFAVNSDQGNEVLFSANRAKDPSIAPHQTGKDMREVAATLRRDIAHACVSLAEARTIAKEALGKMHHWPVSATEEPTSKCTTVDLQVGGSMQVFLRGPSTTS